MIIKLMKEVASSYYRLVIMDWFLYERDLRHERVKKVSSWQLALFTEY